MVNTRCHLAKVFGAILAVASAGCGGPNGPRQAFDAFYGAVQSNDVAAFASLFSTETKKRIEEVESGLVRAGDSPPPQTYAEFAMQRLNVAAPFDQIDVARQRSETVFTFYAQGGKRGRVKFVQEGDAWKLDLVDSVVEWGRLNSWATEANKIIGGRPNAPPIGTLGGIEIQSGFKDVMLLTHEGVPEVLWKDLTSEAGDEARE